MVSLGLRTQSTAKLNLPAYPLVSLDLHGSQSYSLMAH